MWCAGRLSLLARARVGGAERGLGASEAVLSARSWSAPPHGTRRLKAPPARKMPRPRRAAARKSYADIEDGPEVETNDDLIEQPAANVCCADSSSTYLRSLPRTSNCHAFNAGMY